MKELKIFEGIGPVKGMLESINQSMEMIDKATMNFGKRQSQFMDNMLTLSHPTPYRNLRQILSEIERSQEGLRESYFKVEKQKLELEHKQKLVIEDRFEREKNLIDIAEIKAGLESSKKYIGGAIRKIKNYIDQYNSILESIKKERGISELTEKDFEEEEEKYHIKTAYAQALTAARSRQGIIDEGNHIYFYQIGINGAVAQANIINYLEYENKLIGRNEVPSHGMILDFLERVYQSHKGNAAVFAERKAIKLINQESMLQKKLAAKDWNAANN